jgi:hypothetical protein
LNTELKIQKFIGILFVAGVILVTIPYIILSIQFNYPRILRQPVGEILEKFQEGGTGLIHMRWIFIVPLLSGLYTSKSDLYSKDLIELIFLSIHQYGGVILGEHLGQIFTNSWMILTSTAMQNKKNKKHIK